MEGLTYELFDGSPNFESRLSWLFYEAYPHNPADSWRTPLQYAIAIAIKVSQYLNDTDYRWNAYHIITPDDVKRDLARTVAAVLQSDRSGKEKPTTWLKERVQQLMELGIIQKLLEPELEAIARKQIKNTPQ